MWKSVLTFLKRVILFLTSSLLFSKIGRFLGMPPEMKQEMIKILNFLCFFLFFSYCKICGAPEGLISIWILFWFIKKCYKFPEFKWDGVKAVEQYYYHCYRASSSSVVRVSELELGGSWVRFSPGAQIIFSELSGLRILLLPNYHFIIIIILF